MLKFAVAFQWRSICPLVISLILLTTGTLNARGTSGVLMLRPGGLNAYPTKKTGPIQGMYKFAVLRVDFQKDSSSLTTGDGTFDMGPVPSVPDSIMLDPSPHDSVYVRAQLRALHNYYNTVSSGKVSVNWDTAPVLPHTDTQAYHLSHPMRYYGHGFADSTQQQHWSKLVYDSFLMAKDDINFHNVSTVVIFHAGVGQDFDIPLDDSPFDIQSAYLDSDFLQENLPSAQWNALNAAGISDVLVLPETQNQLGVPIALTGTFALLFGARIGLPALYNTANGNSGVGQFGLMDLGSNNGHGISPAYPTAWTRIFAGWENPVTANQSASYQIRSPESSVTAPVVLKIPVNPHEYYLLENRLRHVNSPVFDSLTIDYDTLFVQRDPAGSGVITRVQEYDAGLPGDGVLIWHIDEAVIRNTLADNAINANPEHRGVDLEEADGAQDIGQYYGPLSSGEENGWFFDFWFAKNPGFFHLNPDYPTDADSTIGFTPETHPSTTSNSGAYTGISITQIPAVAPFVAVEVRFNRTIPGFPLHNSEYNTTRFLPLIHGTNSFTFSAIPTETGSDSIHINVLNSGTTTRLSFASTPGDSGGVTSVTGIKESTGGVSYYYVVSSSPGSGMNSHTRLYRLQITPTARSNQVLLADLPGSPTGQVIADSSSLVVATDMDTLYRLNQSGSLEWKQDIPAHIQSLAVIKSGKYLTGTSEGLYSVNQTGVNLIYSQGDYSQVAVSGQELFAIRNSKLFHGVITPGNTEGYYYTPAKDITGVPSAIALGDPDRDGKPELMATIRNSDGQWIVVGLNENSTVVNNFPLSLTGDFAGENLTLADTDGDSLSELFISNNAGVVYGYDNDGTLLPQFPMDYGDSTAVAVFVARMSDGRAGIFGQTVSGVITGNYVHTDDSKICGNIAWTGIYGNPRNTQQARIQEVPVPGTESIAIRRAYIYPNPVEGDLATIRVEATQGKKISITIYDFSGLQIQHWETLISPSETVYEYPWDTSDLPSGVYFGEVTVSGGSSKSHKIIKIALAR